jgi:Tfp pilus assembly protein PilF
MERTSNAEEEYKQALSIDPSMAAAKNALADLLKNETKF